MHKKVCRFFIYCTQLSLLLTILTGCGDSHSGSEVKPAQKSTISQSHAPRSGGVSAPKSSLSITEAIALINSTQTDTGKLEAIKKSIQDFPSQPIELSNRFNQIEPLNVRRMAQLLLLEHLLKHDLKKAWEMANALPAGQLRNESISQCFSSIPAAELHAYYDNLGKDGGLPEELSAARSGIRARLQSLDSKTANSLITKFQSTDPSLSFELASHAGALAAAALSASDLTKFLSNESLPLREGYIEGAFSQKLNQSPEEAISFLDSLPHEGPQPFQAHLKIAELWASRAPKDTLNWAAKIENATQQAQVASAAMKTWIRLDSGAASMWAKDAAPGVTKDTALFTVVDFLAGVNDLEEIRGWVALIQDPRVRSAAEQRIAGIR